jgi:polysaccharide pyruvyl transferase WcaK-like protein
MRIERNPSVSSTTPAIALHGFVYSTNFGDMLLSRLTADIVSRRSPRASISLPFASRPFVRSAGIDCATGLSSFLGADALLYHGGGYFAFPPRFQLFDRTRLYRRFYAPGLAAAALRKPYGIFGVGVGPIRSSFQSLAVRRVFQGASMISVRDEEGHDWLRRIGVPNSKINLAADLAIRLGWSDVPQAAVQHAEHLLADVPGESRIGIHLSAPSTTSQQHSAAIRGILNYLGRHPEVGVVLLCDHLSPDKPEAAPQYQAAVEMAKHLGPRARFVGQPPLWSLVALLGKLDGLITNKLHAGIVSSAFGRRVVSIAKSEKNFRFFRQAGAESRCMRLADCTTTDIPGFLEQGFESLHEPTPLPASLKDLARRNEMLIDRFLEAITSTTPPQHEPVRQREISETSL